MYHFHSYTDIVSFFLDLIVSLHHWSRCDVPFVNDNKTILPKKCTPYLDVEEMSDKRGGGGGGGG
jgi:hypothetical protein